MLPRGGMKLDCGAGSARALFGWPIGGERDEASEAAGGGGGGGGDGAAKTGVCTVGGERVGGGGGGDGAAKTGT